LTAEANFSTPASSDLRPVASNASSFTDMWIVS
jgi:hypothetical protein